jgi:hypothetical protein
MLESKAKTKWCPFARSLPSGSTAAVNRTPKGAPVGRCLASDCMAWRKGEPEGHYVGDVYLGYASAGECGLAAREYLND